MASPAWKAPGCRAEGGQDAPPGLHLREQILPQCALVLAQGTVQTLIIRAGRGGGCGRPGQLPRAKREADAFACPWLEQAGRVASHDDPAVADWGVGAAAAGQVPRVPGRLIRPEPKPADEVLQVLPGLPAVAPGRDHPDRQPLPLGEHPGIRAGNRPPVEQYPPVPLLLNRDRDVDLQFQAKVDLAERHPGVLRADTRGTVRADEHPGAHARAVSQSGDGVLAVLGDPPHRRALPECDASGQRRLAQRIVELLPHHHGEQRLAVLPGELVPAIQGDGRGMDVVACGHRGQTARDGERGAGQAAAAGLVAGMLRPLHHDCARPAGSGGQSSRQAGRPCAHDGDIPPLVSGHRRSVDDRAW